MSEYQYYEFLAVDRPLDQEQMAELRRLSTRATITATRFVNVYNWGNFRGNPALLMERYFDAHLYLANWGTREFMLRLPSHLLDLERVAPYSAAPCLEARSKDGFLLLEFRSDTEEPEDAAEGEGWLAGMLPVRADLATGDLRALYLGWLGAVQREVLEEEALEPPLPPGLGQLSAALRTLADFLRLDDALLAAAAEGSLPLVALQQSNEAVAEWLHALTEAEKDAVLVRLLQGDLTSLRAELLRQVRQARAPAAAASEPRTVLHLLEASERHAERQRQDALAQETRRQREQAEARARHLDRLVGREQELWREVEAIFEEKRISDYASAVQVLRDLRDLAARTEQAAGFQARLHALRDRYRTRTGVLRRLDEASLR